MFMQILAKKLKKDIIRDGSQLANISSELKGKALDFQTTINLRADEYLSDTDISNAEASAEEAAIALVDNLANLTVEKLITQSLSQKSKGKLKLNSPGLLRDKKGKIISAFNLSLLLNASLYRYVQELMGSGGRLNNITGRLAHSGSITNISNRQGSDRVSVMFRYQMAPYSTFEPGGKQGSKARSPKALFTQAIRNALKDLLSPKSSILEKNKLIIRMVK